MSIPIPTIEEFRRERNDALTSLDEKRIRIMVRKFNGTDMPIDPEVFWGAVHKAITGCLDLPVEFRRQSKTYLTIHGLQSHDDGDL